MAEPVRMQLPVFLPGKEHDWEEIQGLATISDDGQINIKLNSPTWAIELVELYKQNKLFAVGFDHLIPGVSK